MDFSKMRFTSEHEWVRLEDGGEVTIGVTEFAAGELGDIVFVELPAVGADVTSGDSMGTIEAVKTVADLFAPVTGSVVAVNSAVEDDPAVVNNSPYEDGWFVTIKMSDASELDKLMTHDAYQESIGQA